VKAADDALASNIDTGLDSGRWENWLHSISVKRM
jgi:hypothetical protein